MAHLSLVLVIILSIAIALFSSAQELDRCEVCSTCEDSINVKRACQCDSRCSEYGDCCVSASESRCSGERAPLLDGLECRSTAISPSEYEETFWMVSSCPSFDRSSIAESCLQRADLPPVTDITTGIAYRNEYCASCNGAGFVAAWRYRLVCIDEFEANLTMGHNITQQLLKEMCTPSTFVSPSMALHPRPCFPSAVTTCTAKTALENIVGFLYTEGEYTALVNSCTQGPYSLVRPDCGRLVIYRNQYCAMCNGHGFENISIVFGDQNTSCYSPGDIIPPCEGPPIDPMIIFPFSVLLDVRGDGQLLISTGLTNVTLAVTCDTSEVFDPINSICRPTICPDGFTLEGGRCSSQGNTTLDCPSGRFIALNASEYVDLGNGTIFYNGEEREVVGVSMGRPLVCVNFSRNGTREENRTVLNFSYPPGFIELTYVGGALSIIGCMFILLTYIIVKELRTLPGKILMNIAAAILIYTLFLLAGAPVGHFSREFCVTVAIVIQLFVLAQFSWMTIMLFEVARNFYNAHLLAPKDSKMHEMYQFIIYLAIGWGTPLVIVLMTIIVNFTTDFVQYGESSDGTEGLCWINHPESLIIAFLVPVAAALLFNIVFFIIIGVLLFKAWLGQSRLHKEKNVPYFRVYLATFTVSGLTWIFGFVALLVGTSWAWYPFIILNSSQGIFICVAFLFTKKVATLYLSGFTSTYKKLSNTVSTSRAQSKTTSDTGNGAVKFSSLASDQMTEGSIMDPSSQVHE